jgi:hypothetical protein
MLRTIDVSQLDENTKAYLKVVRIARGTGSPGLYHTVSSGMPIVAFIAGLLILAFLVWAGYSSNKPAWANAMIQTAGVLLGGWLMLYAVRRWLAGTENYVGHFYYFDPKHVYVGQGDQLQYARLSDDVEAEPIGTSGLRFRDNGRQFQLNLPHRAFSLSAANYYNLVGQIQEDEDYRDLSLAHTGAVAKYIIQNDAAPASLNDLDLNIDEVPTDVRPKQATRFGLLPYLVMLGVAAVSFFIFKATNPQIRDNANFATLKDGDSNKLRDYLLNPNNVAHRDEILELLRKRYETPIAKVRQQGTDEKLREAFVTLLESLRGPERPTISLRVTDSEKNLGLQGWAFALRQRLADGIGNGVGEEFISVVRAPGDPISEIMPPTEGEVKKPAHIEITYSSANPENVTWKIEFRLSPDDAKPYFESMGMNTLTVQNPNGNPLPFTEAIYQDLMTNMIGQAPFAPPPLPLEDW